MGSQIGIINVYNRKNSRKDCHIGDITIWPLGEVNQKYIIESNRILDYFDSISKNWNM